MTTPSDVYVYDLFTWPNSATKAMVGAVVLSVLGVRPAARLHRWNVAVTREQVLHFCAMPWVITAMHRGPMYQQGENLQFHDPERHERWSVAIESLTQ